MKYDSWYRAIVEDVRDPETRYRCRVRVIGIHSQAAPVDCLPWAEVATMFVGPGSGDFTFLEKGDRVWVAFEQGNVDMPLIVGGWVSKRRGVNDIPPDLTTDYLVNRRKRVIMDRVGNVVELSSVDDELWIKLRSGKSELVLTKKDDSVTIRTPGVVKVDAGQAVVNAGQAYLEAGDTTIAANKKTSGVGTGTLHLVSNMDINLYVRDIAQGGNPAGEINIGQYTDDGSIASAGVPAPHQSPVVNVFSAIVNVGQYDSGLKLPTLEVNIAAATEVNIDSAGLINIQGDTSVLIKSLAQVNIDAPLINIGI